jgi:hypothetical protein
MFFTQLPSHNFPGATVALLSRRVASLSLTVVRLPDHTRAKVNYPERMKLYSVRGEHDKHQKAISTAAKME